MNSSYSLRAFARDLGVTPPQLSSVIAGKKGLSKERAKSIALHLGLTKFESALFVGAIAAEHGRSQTEKQMGRKQVEKIMDGMAPDFGQVQEAKFQVIADWYHLAILQLSETKGFIWKAEHISSRLGISVTVAESALAALEKSGLILKKGRRYEKANKFVKTEDVPSRAIRTFHKQVLSLAIAAVDEQSIEERDLSSVFVTINRDRIPRLKEWIRSFREEFCASAGQGPNRDDVYSLSLQFFKLSKPKPKKEIL